MGCHQGQIPFLSSRTDAREAASELWMMASSSCSLISSAVAAPLLATALHEAATPSPPSYTGPRQAGHDLAGRRRRPGPRKLSRVRPPTRGAPAGDLLRRTLVRSQTHHGPTPQTAGSAQGLRLRRALRRPRTHRRWRPTPRPRGHTTTSTAWPAVHHVAAGLFFHGQAGHREVCTALGLSDDGGPGSAELAGIQAGLRGVG